MKLLYELKKEDELIEEEYQDFPMKLYKEEVIEKYLHEIGFSGIEVLNKNEKDNVFSVISCQK